MTLLLQISDSGEITIPHDMIKQSGMHPGDIIEATIEGASVIIRRPHSIDYVNEEVIRKTKSEGGCVEEGGSENLPSWDPSPFFGSLKPVFAERSSIEIGKQLRDEWERT